LRVQGLGSSFAESEATQERLYYLCLPVITSLPSETIEARKVNRRRLRSSQWRFLLNECCSSVASADSIGKKPERIVSSVQRQKLHETKTRYQSHAGCPIFCAPWRQLQRDHQPGRLAFCRARRLAPRNFSAWRCQLLRP
jgi:hypothetical protein